MLIFTIIMFAAAALFLALGIAIFNGKTSLIHDYHQKNVKESEQKNYGRAFSKGMFALCITFIVSGTLSSIGKYAKAAVIALYTGLFISIIIIIKVQKKYNGGIFS